MSSKRILIPFLLVLVLACAAALAGANPHSDEGPLASMTGAPATGGVPAETNCTLCHQDYDHPCAPDPCNLNAPGGGIEILGVPYQYVPGEVYPLRVRLWSDSTLTSDSPLWGFEMTAIRSADGSGAGSWQTSSPDSFAILPGSGPFASRSYIEQTYNGARHGLFGEVEWAFEWRAPADGAGEIAFHAAGVAANGNDEPGAGDFVYTGQARTNISTVAVSHSTWGRVKALYR